MKPLRPEKGEKFVPPGPDTVFEWDGKMWVDTGAKAVPTGSEAMNGKTGLVRTLPLSTLLIL